MASETVKKFLDEAGLNALWRNICKTINNVVSEYVPKTINVTHAELVNLRDSNKLKPGAKYRIIDYVTSVASNLNVVQSAEHEFDIVVEALDDHTLSEIASAAYNADRDEYFKNEKLESWQIWYCLDNDKTRFEWANSNTPKAAFVGVYVDDPSNVLYPDGDDRGDMIYEWDIDTDPETGEDNIILYKSNVNIYPTEGTDYNDGYFYRGIITVDGEEYDSWQKYEKHDGVTWEAITNNILDVKGYVYYLTERLVFDGAVVWPKTTISGGATGVIYRMIDQHGNDCPYDFKNIMFYNDRFGQYVYTFSYIENDWALDSSVHGNTKDVDWTNTWVFGVHNNIIKPCMSSAVFGVDKSAPPRQVLGNNVFVGSDQEDQGAFTGCCNNYIGCDCYNNFFFAGCHNNILNSGCYNNAFEVECNYNILGAGCYNNTFGNRCNHNIFDEGCIRNIINGGYNHFGGHCHDNNISGSTNSFGIFCDYISIGNNCDGNTFGNNCSTIRFCYEDDSKLLSYCRYNTFLDYTSCIIYSTDNPRDKEYLQNFVIDIKRDPHAVKEIHIDANSFNRNYITKVAKNSSGVIKIYCEADLIA